MTEQVYVSRRVDTTTHYHKDPSCPSTKQGLRPVDEAPDGLLPCSYCAGGLSARDIRDMVGGKNE